MTLKRIGALAIALLFAMSVLFVCGCGDDDDDSPPPPPPPSTGTLSVTVMDAATADLLENALVIVQDGASGDILAQLITDINGYAEVVLDVTTVQLLVARQGFTPSPPTPDAVPLPYDILGGQITAATVNLNPLEGAENLGLITGTVYGLDGVTGFDGVLLVSDMGTTINTTYSGSGGLYVMFNVPAGMYDIEAWHAGANFPSATDVSVTANEGTSGVDITQESEATASLNGSLTFRSSSSAPVDVTLILQDSGVVIPGLQVMSDANDNYQIGGIPDGSFYAIASRETDGFVMDPDVVITSGFPPVEVTGNVTSENPLPFVATGAVLFNEPVDIPEIPRGEGLVISGDRNSSYASSSFLVFELIDETSTVVAGGFDFSWTIDSAPSWSVTLDTTTLDVNALYQVRVYALDDDGTANGIPDASDTILSSTENLEGVFSVIPSTLCSDGYDNDGDGWTDMADPDCIDGIEEVVVFGMTQCNDGIDNDSDLDIDAADADCEDALDDLEAASP